MMVWRRIAGAAALVGLAVSGAAQAAGTRCLDQDDLAAVVRFALPGAIASAGAVCRSAGGPDSYLAREGPALIARYRQGRDDAWPQARAAIMRVGIGTLTGREGLGPLAGLLPDGTLMGMADAAIAGYVSRAVHTADCPDIDAMSRLTAPLPPENTARLIALAVRRLDRPGPAPQRRPALPLCRLAPAPVPPSSPEGHD